jgi:hypothetical protein
MIIKEHVNFVQKVYTNGQIYVLLGVLLNLYLKKISFVMMINASLVWNKFTKTNKMFVKRVTKPVNCVQIDIFAQNVMKIEYFIMVFVLKNVILVHIKI